MDEKLNVYQLLVPNESITFKSDDDKVAMATCLILAQGQAAAIRLDKSTGIEVRIPSLTIFNENASEDIEKFLGSPLSKFLPMNEQKMSDCLASFAYVSIDERKDFDNKLYSFQSSEAKNKFLGKHEEKKRGQYSRWVSLAWSYSRALQNKMFGESISKN